MSRVMEDLLTPSELFQRHISSPVKIIIRVPRYTILSLAEDYANFSNVAFFFFSAILWFILKPAGSASASGTASASGIPSAASAAPARRSSHSKYEEGYSASGKYKIQDN